METSAAASTTPLKSRLKGLQSYGIVLIAGLLIGLLPTGISLFRATQQLHDARRQVQIQSLELHLARAAVLARRGDYPGARDATSQFFSAARLEVDSRSNEATPRLALLRSLLNERDAVITLLARSDPAGAERLAEMYVSFQAVAD